MVQVIVWMRMSPIKDLRTILPIIISAEKITLLWFVESRPIYR